MIRVLTLCVRRSNRRAHSENISRSIRRRTWSKFRIFGRLDGVIVRRHSDGEIVPPTSVSVRHNHHMPTNASPNQAVQLMQSRISVLAAQLREKLPGGEAITFTGPDKLSHQVSIATITDAFSIGMTANTLVFDGVAMEFGVMRPFSYPRSPLQT